VNDERMSGEGGKGGEFYLMDDDDSKGALLSVEVRRERTLGFSIYGGHSFVISG
jgi:hypothetical protein